MHVLNFKCIFLAFAYLWPLWCVCSIDGLFLEVSTHTHWHFRTRTETHTKGLRWRPVYAWLFPPSSPQLAVYPGQSAGVCAVNGPVESGYNLCIWPRDVHVDTVDIGLWRLYLQRRPHRCAARAVRLLPYGRWHTKSSWQGHNVGAGRRFRRHGEDGVSTMMCLCERVCLFLAFDLSVAFDACARLKRAKHAHHVIYIICVAWSDFTSVLRCVFENRWVRFVCASSSCVRIVCMSSTLNACSLHLHIYDRCGVFSIDVVISWGKHAHTLTRALRHTRRHCDVGLCMPDCVFPPPHRGLRLDSNQLASLPASVFGGLSVLT